MSHFYGIAFICYEACKNIDIVLKCVETEGTLRIHVETVHENMKPYKCDVCEKGFKKNLFLK